MGGVGGLLHFFSGFEHLTSWADEGNTLSVLGGTAYRQHHVVSPFLWLNWFLGGCLHGVIPHQRL